MPRAEWINHGPMSLSKLAHIVPLLASSVRRGAPATDAPLRRKGVLPRLRSGTIFGSLLALNLVACSTGPGVGPGEDGPGGEEEEETPIQVTGASLAEELRTAVQREWGGFSDTAKATDEVDGAKVPLALLKNCAAEQDEEFDADVDTAVTNLEDAMDEVLDLALSDILKDEWIESDNGTTVVFRLNAASYCEDNEWCLDDLQENPVRASAIKTADGTYVVEILVGTEESRVATLRLSDGLMDMSADLADLLTFLERTVDSSAAKDLPEFLLGKVSVRVQKDGSGRSTVSFGITEALAMDLDTDDGPVNVQVAAAPNAGTFSLDSTTNTVEVAMDLGAVDVKTPAKVLCGGTTAVLIDPNDSDSSDDDTSSENDSCGEIEENGRLAWHLAGASAAVVSSPSASDSWTVSGIGLGDDTTHWDLNGEPLAAYDLNATEGRKVSITITEESASTLVTFEPALNMKLAMQLNRLSDELKVDMPDWLMDEIFDVTFGGPAKKSVRIPKVAGCGGTGAEQVEVVEGSLELNASSLSSPITVEAGMCLVERDSESEHPFEAFGTGVCE